MKPAISVILLTTLIGAGQGLFIAVCSVDWLARMGILDAPFARSAEAALLSVGLMAAGLAASFFHLGHPERAWRAAAMWRTSWLSREVIALPAAMATVLGYALVQLLDIDRQLLLVGDQPLTLLTLVGLLALFAVLVLYLCTAMIYASLRFLRQWHSPLTVLNFVLMGLASGFVLATLIAGGSGDGAFDYLSRLAILFTLAALLSRGLSLWRNQRLRAPATLQSAIGVHHPSIRQIAQGAMGGSFNTRAFMHDYGPAVLRLARRFFLLGAFVIPAILVLFGDPDQVALLMVAVLIQFAGLLVERWYFFIEAEHPQNVYYQMIS